MAKFPINIGSSFEIDTDVWHLRVEVVEGMQAAGQVERSREGVRVRVSGEVMRQKGAEAWLYGVVAEELRRRGKVYLVKRTQELAREYGLKVGRVTVKNVVSRWGSCSSLGNVNLNLWLMLFDAELIDLVIKHELTHLTHMNHGAAFHALLNERCGGKEKQLEQRMKEELRRIRASEDKKRARSSG